MSVVYAESRFDKDAQILDSRAAYDAVCEVPHRLESRWTRFVRAAICLACFAAIGAMLAACGGGEDESAPDEAAYDEAFVPPRLPRCGGHDLAQRLFERACANQIAGPSDTACAEGFVMLADGIATCRSQA